MIQPAERLSLVSEYYFSRKLKEVAQLNAEGQDIISLAIGSPDMPPSEKTIEKLCEVARQASDNATFSRGSNVTVTNCYFSEELPGASGQGEAIGNMSDEALLAELGSGWQVKDDVLKPAMAKSPDILNPVFKGVTINATASTTLTPTGDGKVIFIGIYNPETLPGGNTSNLYLGAGNQLYWPSADKTVNAFRAYFNVNGVNNVREIRLNFGDDDTSIHNSKFIIHNYNYAGAKGLYNLSGQKVSDDYKGIVIKNGKKYVKE